MGRLIKELKYSIGMKRHVFFLVLLCFVVCGTSWLFQDTLEKELGKAFPSLYAPELIATEDTEYQIQGTVTQKSPQVTDADLKAEITFNEQLRAADWITEYRAIAREYFQVASFLGPDSAVKGFGTDAFYSNKDIDSSGNKYTTVDTVWLEEKLVDEFKLGTEAKQIFKMPNNYLEKIYVVLGAKYKMEDGYQVGNILKTKNDIGSLQMQIVGFLAPGAKVKIGGKEVELDSSILCPFLSLSDVYIKKEEVTQTYLDGVYISAKNIDETLTGVYRNNPPSKKNDPKTGIQYAEVRGIWIDRSALTEDAPAWLKTLEVAQKEPYTRVYVGANYGLAEKLGAGTQFDMYAAGGLKKLQSFGTLEPGTTWNVYGMDILLDDYIVFLQPEEEKPETPGDATLPEDGDLVLDDVPEGPQEIQFKVAERAKLFHFQCMMNRGYFTTTYTADEAQTALEDVVEVSWRAFRRDNPKKSVLTSYRVVGADQPNSILFRASSEKLAKSILKFTKYGFRFCMVVFGLYLLYKFYRGRDYYTVCYFTGTTKLEMMILYVIEGVLMIVLASAGSVAFAYAICYLLQLKMSAPAPLFKSIRHFVGVPTVFILVVIALKDFARRFRKAKEV